MPSDIRQKLREAILDEEARELSALKESHESDRAVEEIFEPIGQAAEEIREELEALPSIAFTVNPNSVWITLFDRELRFTYDRDSEKFRGEEIGHSWYDGETYTERYGWDTADACIDAMIRSCAKYARMARAIRSAESQG